MLNVYEIDPLQDERWEDLLATHPSASLFHSTEWLSALQRTYGYRVGAFTTSEANEPLTNGLVFCRVRSWVTGPRLVSLPFSDHCAPLLATGEQLEILLSHLKEDCDCGKEKYLELRSSAQGNGGLGNSASFCLHKIDLRADAEDLFHALHGNCIRRKIARAQREGVTYETGTSDQLLHDFYQLNVMTRRRHGVPPQPLPWFRNLIGCMGDKVKIRVASYKGRPAAAILTIRYKATMTYKYGCSDATFHKLGPMQLLMWNAIQEAKAEGLLEFDMGRTDLENEGLLTFKDRWGAARSTLTYLRYPAPKAKRATEGSSLRFAKSLFALAPSRLLPAAGTVLYPHID